MKKRLLMIMCFMFAIVFFIGNIYAEEDDFELAYRKYFELTNEEYESDGVSLTDSKDGGYVICWGYHNPTVVKYDKDGNEEWKLKDFASEEDEFYNEEGGINFKRTEIGYILVSNSNIYLISEDGKLIKKYFESNEIVEFEAESIYYSNFVIDDDGGITIINTSNGLNQLQYYNPSGELTYTKDLNESIDLTGISFSNGKHVILKYINNKHEYYLIDKDFSNETKINFNIPSEYFELVGATDEKFAITYEYEEDGKGYSALGLFNQSGELVKKISYPLEYDNGEYWLDFEVMLQEAPHYIGNKGIVFATILEKEDEYNESYDVIVNYYDKDLNNYTKYYLLKDGSEDDFVPFEEAYMEQKATILNDESIIVTGNTYEENNNNVVYKPFHMQLTRLHDGVDYGDNSVYIKSVNVEDKTEGVYASRNVLDKLSVKFNVKFLNKDDYVKYKVVVHNGTREDYEIKLPKNDSEYITYKYEFDKNNNVIKPNKDKIVYVTIKYNREVPASELESGSFKEEKNLVLSFNEKEFVNPMTGSTTLMVIVICLLIIVGSLVVFKYSNKKILNAFIIGLVLIIPVGMYALESVKINVASSVEVLKKYTITYNKNNENATGDLMTQEVGYGTSVKLKENTYNYEGYRVIEWNTKADGSGKYYYPNNLIKVEGDITLYAMWVLEP